MKRCLILLAGVILLDAPLIGAAQETRGEEGEAKELAGKPAAGAPLSKTWLQFVEAKKTGDEPTLPDFSYAGYHGGVDPIPDVKAAVFDVTKYGAKGDGKNDDQDAIQKAIDAAQAAGGGVVFLPAGTYRVNTDMAKRRSLLITKGNMVLRGAGAGPDGSVILIDEPTLDVRKAKGPGGGESSEEAPDWLLQIQPPKGPRPAKLATVTGDCPREGFSFTVDNAEKLKPGMWVALYVKSKDIVPGLVAPYQLEEMKKTWTRIHASVGLVEHHLVKAVEGNRVTLREPVHTAIKAQHGWYLTEYPHISEVAVEDLCFMGGWLGKFSHHRSWMDDNGWCALKMSYAVDSWVRRCAFINLNQCLNFESCACMSVIQNVLGGTMGHFSINEPRRSTGMLFGLTLDCMERQGKDTTHGVGAAGCSVGTVYWRYTMQPDQSFDMHGNFPYATLFDAMTGGNLTTSGGPEASFPNHLRDFVCWNFEHVKTPPYRGSSEQYNFWGGRPSLVKPVFAGMHGVPAKINEEHAGIIESPGVAVEPASLYEAQLALRFGAAPLWVAKAEAEWAAMQKALPPFLHSGDNAPWVAAKRAQIIRYTLALPMTKDRYDKTDPLGALIKEWPASDGSPWPPYLDPPQGSYSAPVKVRIAGGPDEGIHYTTDGSAPTDSSALYSAPLELTANTTVKAIAIKKGHKSSFLSAATYSVKPN